MPFSLNAWDDPYLSRVKQLCGDGMKIELVINVYMKVCVIFFFLMVFEEGQL